MNALLDPRSVIDRAHAVGAGGENVHALNRLARLVDGTHFDAEAPRHLLGELLAMLWRRAEDLAQSNVADARERLEEGARHASRAEYADDMGILARKILGADAGARADAHVLQYAIIDEGKRLGVAGRDKEDQAAIGSRLAAKFLLRPIAVRVLGPGDDVRLHADGKITVIGAFHGPQRKYPSSRSHGQYISIADDGWPHRSAVLGMPPPARECNPSS